MTRPDDAPDERLPRYFANGLNLAIGAYDATLTFIEVDQTALPQDQVGPHQPSVVARVQIVTALGHLKSMIPMLVKAISAYESQFGSIPAPGFEEDSKS